jgi:hypothetical protein
VFHGTGATLVPHLASIIRAIMTLEPQPNTQVYTFSSAEHTALQSHLIDEALVSREESDDIRLCIGALSQGAALLQTTYQPTLLSNTLLEFLAKNSRTKRELQDCLARLHLSTAGHVTELRERLTHELNRSVNKDRRKELGQLPRVVVVKQEVDRLLALPSPGYWDLPECVKMLDPKTKCPEDEEVYEAFVNGRDVETLLEKRNIAIYAILKGARKMLKTQGKKLLVNKANVLTSDFMDLCREENLRKLFFMQQVSS